MANLVALRNAWKISQAQNWLELQCSDLMALMDSQHDIMGKL